MKLKTLFIICIFTVCINIPHSAIGYAPDEKINIEVYEKISPLFNGEIKLVDVEYVKKNDGMHLIIYIDKENGVTVDDCVEVSRIIDEPLEELEALAFDKANCCFCKAICSLNCLFCSDKAFSVLICPTTSCHLV